jgi:hypothetical protein
MRKENGKRKRRKEEKSKRTLGRGKRKKVNSRN